MRGGAAAAALCLATLAGAQESDPHDAMPERPTVATHAYTIAPGWTELEFGVELDHADTLHAFSTPTTWKVGLARRLQIETTAYWISQWDGATISGFGDLTVALKWRLADTLPVLGDFAIQPMVRFPTGSTALGAGQRLGGILVISSNHLGPVELDVNGGFFHRLDDRATAPAASMLWTVSAGTPVRGPLAWTLELYGYPGTSGPAGSTRIIALLTGPTYQVHPWFVADAGLIVPIKGPQPHGVYAGLTWNIGRLWNATRATAPSR